ncbi:MAG TPA: hypothetical protein VJR27_02165 [Candidatus Saccharimonadales bacterium]|nr:hypothetical protein [Candidatus Saccharimonadales bacterium]
MFYEEVPVPGGGEGDELIAADIPFEPASEHRRTRQEHFFGKITGLLEGLAEQPITPGKEVRVLHPARWLTKNSVRHEFPGIPRLHWTVTQQLGWLLSEVVQPDRMARTSNRGPLLLLDNAQCAFVGRLATHEWQLEKPPFILPEELLSPLDPDLPVRLDIAYAELSRIVNQPKPPV